MRTRVNQFNAKADGLEGGKQTLSYFLRGISMTRKKTKFGLQSLQLDNGFLNFSLVKQML